MLESIRISEAAIRITSLTAFDNYEARDNGTTTDILEDSIRYNPLDVIEWLLNALEEAEA